MIVGVVCCVLVGLLALYQTFAIRAYRDAADISIESARRSTARLGAQRVIMRELDAGLSAMQQAMADGNVAALAAAIAKTRMAIAKQPTP